MNLAAATVYLANKPSEGVLIVLIIAIVLAMVAAVVAGMQRAIWALALSAAIAFFILAFLV